MKKVGFTIGKFAPLHKGHQYLIEKGISEMDEFFVVLYETDKINIDIEKRAEWIKNIYPNIKVIIAKNPPSQYGLDEESVNIQMKYLCNIIKNESPNHFFSSEDYGECVAKYMNIENVIVDRNRITVPISASIIRNDFNENSKWLNPIVYEECINFARKL